MSRIFQRMNQLMSKFNAAAKTPLNKKKQQKSVPPAKKPSLVKSQSSIAEKPQQPIKKQAVKTSTKPVFEPPTKPVQRAKIVNKPASSSSFSVNSQQNPNLKRNSSKSSIKRTDELYQRGLEHLNVRNQLIVENQERKLFKEIEECTFTPVVRKKPNYLRKYENIIQKTRTSQQRKDQKSINFHHSRMDSELRECTFTPNISRQNPTKQSKSRCSSIAKPKENGSFHKSSSSTSLQRKSLRNFLKSSFKKETDSVSSRKSVKESDKIRFRKANEEFVRTKKQGFFFDFDPKDRKASSSKKSRENSSLNTRSSIDRRSGLPEDFSREINETLNIFSRMRQQMAQTAQVLQKPVMTREKSRSLSKRSLSRKSSGIEKKLHSLGKTELIRGKAAPGKPKGEQEKKAKETQRILEFYKEETRKYSKAGQKHDDRKVGKIRRNEGVLAKRYEGLLQQAENITHQLKKVLNPK